MWEIQDYETQCAMADPIAFAASSNPDTMYLHEALTCTGQSQIHQGNATGSQRPQRQATLGDDPKVTSTGRNHHSACCLVDEAKATYQHQRDLQVESAT
jgi:hypothetical protein